MNWICPTGHSLTSAVYRLVHIFVCRNVRKDKMFSQAHTTYHQEDVEQNRAGMQDKGSYLSGMFYFFH